jgi:RNA polymerase sigma-70 factor (ECF subfamily)
MEDELTLIEKAKINPQDFKPLYEKYFNDVFRFVLSRVSDIDTTKDLVSDIFCKILQSLPHYTYQSTSGFKSWIFKIAYTSTMEFFRLQKKELNLTIDEKDFHRFVNQIAEENSNSEEDKELLKKQLIKALQNLHTDDLQLIELRFFDNLSYAEIAQITGKTETNVKTKTFRLLKKLQSEILKSYNHG